MIDTHTADIEVLRVLHNWDVILRGFGCSEDQIRELYRVPREDWAKIAEELEEARIALEKEAEDEARDQAEKPQN